ncbi:MAG: nucleotidyl transferase AbiEii/AbiGii toxin family protein [Bacteroidota bacterium]
MTNQQFFNAISNGGDAVLRRILDLLKKARARYCVIGDLAVNAYVEPVVSLDLDIVVITDGLDTFLTMAQRIFKVERYQHSINLKAKQSDLRIQVQLDQRYQDFISRALRKKVLGQQMKVAALEDVFQGKLWAYSDKQRRMSKRQKDLADIYRLVESYPHLKSMLPKSLQK